MIKARRHSGERIDRLVPALQARCLPWLVVGWLCFGGISGQAGPVVTLDSPIGFFTNVAARLLQSQLGLSLTNIQLYPTNQYTPSVHQLLQVTANLYDAATNRTDTGYPYLPSVFRPIIRYNPANDQYLIAGYVEVLDTTPTTVPVVDLPYDFPPLGHPFLSAEPMVSGIPLVIGAKKGYPNFNQFAMQTTFTIMRKLQFLRQNLLNNTPIALTNQMYVLNISNAFGIEAWNSYTSTYPRNLSINVIVANMNVCLTDAQAGQSWLFYTNFSTDQTVSANTWTGFTGPYYAAGSAIIPLLTNYPTLTNSQYLQHSVPPELVPVIGQGNTFESPSGRQSPDWWLTLTNRLRYALIDTSVTPNRIVDFVNLEACGAPMHITQFMGGGGCAGSMYSPSSEGTCPLGYTGPSDEWCTNSTGGTSYGVLNQIYVDLGVQPNNCWASTPLNWAACDFFRAQFPGFTALHYPGRFTMTNTFYAPYVPTYATNFSTVWQANDPLVHYMLSDLVGLTPTTIMLDHFGLLINERYEPWGGNPLYDYPGSSPTDFDLTIKDPFMVGSDYWDFPTNPLPDLTWIGRVHRGTPWQTIYLKAPGTSLAEWVQWTGNDQLVTNWDGMTGVTQDAFFTQPTNDWRLASLVVSLLNPNDLRTLASANQPSVSAWCGLLNGMTVLTNNLADDQLDPYGPPEFAAVIMSSNSPQASAIAAALVAAGASQPGQYFQNVGDILAVPELSTASPWLNLSSTAQLEYGLSDQAYEAIPSQLLPLLRPDSIGSISQSGGAFQVQFTGADGYAYVVQTSSNLLNWTAVTTNYPVGGSFNFVDTLPPGSPRRFYRSLLWP